MVFLRTNACSCVRTSSSQRFAKLSPRIWNSIFSKHWVVFDGLIIRRCREICVSDVCVSNIVTPWWGFTFTCHILQLVQPAPSHCGTVTSALTVWLLIHVIHLYICEIIVWHEYLCSIPLPCVDLIQRYMRSPVGENTSVGDQVQTWACPYIKYL